MQTQPKFLFIQCMLIWARSRGIPDKLGIGDVTSCHKTKDLVSIWIIHPAPQCLRKRTKFGKATRIAQGSNVRNYSISLILIDIRRGYILHKLLNCVRIAVKRLDLPSVVLLFIPDIWISLAHLCIRRFLTFEVRSLECKPLIERWFSFERSVSRRKSLCRYDHIHADRKSWWQGRFIRNSRQH